MKQLSKNLLATLVALLNALTVFGQYKVELTSYPIDSYICERQLEVTAETVARKLGMEVEELQNALVEDMDNGIVYIQHGDSQTNAFTGNMNEWWMTMDGTPVSYDNGAVWLAVLVFISAAELQSGEDVLNFHVGQMPGAFKSIEVPTLLNTTLCLKKNGREVTFEISLKILPTNSFEADGLFYKITSHEGLTCEVACKNLNGIHSYSGAISKPSSVEFNSSEYAVTSIGDKAFLFYDGLTSVEISNSVTFIGDSAFWGCTSLTSVEIPGSVKSIGDGASVIVFNGVVVTLCVTKLLCLQG